MNLSMPALLQGVSMPSLAHASTHAGTRNKDDYCRLLGADPRRPESFAGHLPFAPGDATAGTENELQSAVIGSGDDVDLPMVIAASNYLQNIRKRTLSGEAPQQLITDLERFLADNPSQVWENSWVRFPNSALNENARNVFSRTFCKTNAIPRVPCGRMPTGFPSKWTARNTPGCP